MASATCAHRALPDLGEDRVAQLAENLRGDAGDAIADDEERRHGDERRPARGEHVDRVLVQHRDIDGDRLGGDQQADRRQHSDAQLPIVARPQKRQQLRDRPQLLAESDLGVAVDAPPLAAAVPAHAQCVFSPRGSLAAIATTAIMIIAPR